MGNYVRYFIFSPQEKLSDSITAAFHTPRLELMNLEETKKNLVYERYLKKRVLGLLSKSVYLFLSYQKLDIKNFSGIVDHKDG